MVNDKTNLTILSISPISLWSKDLREDGAGSQAIPLTQEGFAKAGHNAVILIVRGTNFRVKGEPKKCFYRGFLIYRVYIPRILSLILEKKYLNYISLKFYYLWYYIFSFFYGLKIAREIKPDIIIGYTNYSAIPSFLISKIMRIPYVYRENGTWSLYDDIQTFWGRIKRFDAILAFKLPCAAMILTDDGTRSNLVAKFFRVPSHKIYFWKNGISKKDFCGLNRTYARRKLNLSSTYKIIVSVGRLSRGKRFDVIIKALAELKQTKDYMCIIIGDGPEMLNLRRLIDFNNLKKHVLLTGALTHSSVWDYLVASDLVIALGSINPLLEGMCVGRCVITLNLGSTYQMTNEGKSAVVIEEEDLDNLAYYIDNLLNDDIRRENIERSALKWISENFETWEDRIKKEVHLIEDIVRKHSY